MPLLSILIINIAMAQSAQPDLTPDPRIAAAIGQASGEIAVQSLDADTFARLALIVSGADENRTEKLTSRLLSAAAELKASLAAKTGSAQADDSAKTEAVMEYLYSRILTRYSELQTRVDAALESGTYNCVSASILFYYLAESVGLDVEGVETPEHSFCTVLINGARIDVETTNPYGFNPGSKKALVPSAADEKRWVIVPQTKYLNRKPVGDRRLLALVYGNRITIKEREGDYAQAVTLAVNADALQGTAESRRSLAQSFVNYAIGLSRQGKHLEGIDFIVGIEVGREPYAGYADYIASASGAYLNDCMTKDDFRTAFDFLSRYQAAIESGQYGQLSLAVTFNYLQYTVDRTSLDGALTEIHAAHGTIPASEYEKLIVYAWSREGERIAKGKLWLEAAAAVEKGLTEIPGQSDLLRQRIIYRQNYAIDIHNKAAAAWNSGNAETVRQLLDDALSLVPESALLRNDRSKME